MVGLHLWPVLQQIGKRFWRSPFMYISIDDLFNLFYRLWAPHRTSAQRRPSAREMPMRKSEEMCHNVAIATSVATVVYDLKRPGRVCGNVCIVSNWSWSPVKGSMNPDRNIYVSCSKNHPQSTRPPGVLRATPGKSV